MPSLFLEAQGPEQRKYSRQAYLDQSRSGRLENIRMIREGLEQLKWRVTHRTLLDGMSRTSPEGKARLKELVTQARNDVAIQLKELRWRENHLREKKKL